MVDSLYLFSVPIKISANKKPIVPQFTINDKAKIVSWDSQFEGVVNNLEQKHSQTTYTRLLTRDDGYIPLNVLKKALKNEPIIYDELPKIIKEYLNKNPNLKIQISKQYQNSKSKNSNSLNTEYCVLNTNLLIYNLWRGLSPWPGLWTTIKINSIDKRLKLLDLSLSELPITNFQLHINSVQLEGKSPIAYKEFSKYYSL